MALDIDERAAVIEVVREFAQAELAPHALEWDAEKHFPIDTLARAGELGLGGIYASEEHGGTAMSRTDAVAVFEELAKGDVALAAYISIHNMVVWMIDAFGSDELRAEWVPRLATLQERASYCLTEPGAGSDAASLRTAARRDGDDFLLTGTKQFISGAGSSAAYIVMARTGEPGAHGISAFVVPGDAPGLAFGPNERKMGWNTQPTRQVILDGVRVPATSILGAEGDGFRIAMRGLDGGRLNMAACSIGGAQWTLDRAVAYVREREAFGRPLAENQAVSFALADAETKLQAARGLVERAAEKLDANAPDKAVACAMAKRFATDAAFEVANEALQLHGGYGYLHEYGIEKVVRDLRVHQLLEGTNEIMRMIIARSMLEA